MNDSTSDMTRELPDFLLKPAESLVNAALAADPAALKMLGNLAGRKIAVELSDFSIAVTVVIEPERVVFGSDGEEPPNATVSGRLASLLAAARSGTARGLTVTGDAELVQGLARVMSRLPQALWERIARSIGDVPARGVERLGRALLGAFDDTHARLATTLGEYLQYELRAVASRNEVEDFSDEVDRLRADAERLGKRVERLARGSRA